MESDYRKDGFYEVIYGGERHLEAYSYKGKMFTLRGSELLPSKCEVLIDTYSALPFDVSDRPELI